MMHQKKLKRTLGTVIAMLSLAILSIQPITSFASYQFGLTETGSAFYYDNTNYCYSMVIPKTNDNYVYEKVSVSSVIDAGGCLYMGVYASTGSIKSSDTRYAYASIWDKSQHQFTNYIYEDGYRYCYLKIGVSRAGNGYGVWDPNNAVQ